MHRVTTPIRERAPRGSVDLIAEYEAWLKRERRSAYTIEQYVGLLRRMDRQLPEGVSLATAEELAAWIYDERKRGTGPRAETTYAHYITIVKGFGRWATSAERMDFHWSEELPELKATSPYIRPATEQEFAAIRERAPEPWRDIYELAGFAGLRCVEIARVDRAHMTQREIRVLGKGNKPRAVPTHPHLWQRFAGRGPGPLARGRDGRGLDRAQVINFADSKLRRLGFEVSMHQLRKRFATRVYKESGHDIRLVQRLLGHANVNTTQVYLGVDMDEAADVVGRLG